MNVGLRYTYNLNPCSVRVTNTSRKGNLSSCSFCVETTYFGMGSDIYQLEEGLVTGLPLSPVLANIYME